MEIPQEIFDGKKLIVFLDTPSELEKAVKEYNKEMKRCKPKMKLVHMIEDAFLILNPLVVIAVYAINRRGFFTNPALAAGLLTLCAGVYVTLGIMKRYLWSVALVTVPLLLLDWRIAFLLAADIILLLWYNKLIEPLKLVRGYPDFIEIGITYEKSRKPQTIDERKI
ncbi:MAG: hypothetical protein K2J80_12870 [Oscillospiraceae bacterium]|nr:hypothetical protein [Oscillospiraceae bacterium]